VVEVRRSEDGGPRLNLELKALDPDPGGSLDAGRALGAHDAGTIHQRDTYFGVSRGRLKLREESPGAPHLIAYERADEAAARASRYRTVAVTDAAMRETLAGVLGVVAVVEKRRRLLLWEGVRVRLDLVAGLGSFVELEAVASPGSDLAHERGLIDRLRSVLDIADHLLVPRSDADGASAAGAPMASGTTIRSP
jgi:adenylate cyclase, class 2